MLLVHPPVAKACEPPAGIAKLAGALRAKGIPCRLLDANLEGQLFLIGQPAAAADTWTRRAGSNRLRHLAALRDPATYRSRGRYDRALRDLDRLLAVAGRGAGVVIGLADCQHSSLSPLRSTDLLAAAERPEQDPFFAYFRSRLPEVIEQDEPRLVGFSVNFLHQALCAFAMIGFLRRRYPSLPVVLGGGLITSWMQRPGWREPFSGLADRCISGPGEGPLLALLNAPEPRSATFRPDYDGLPLQDYLAPGVIAPYSASSGCCWRRCSFCPENAEENAYLPVPPDRALLELHGLASSTGPALLHLLDNAVSPALLRRIAADPPGVPWYGFSRIGPELADPDLCRALKRSGCAMLKLGLESGDQQVLDALGKGIDLGMASRVLRNLRSAGIAAYVYLLFGTPPENEEAARRTLAFTAAHAGMIDFLNLAVFNMPVCSREAAACATGPFTDGDLSLYTDFRHPEGWDRRRVRTFLEREFTRHRAIAAIVRNDPPFFTSSHAAFFAGR